MCLTGIVISYFVFVFLTFFFSVGSGDSFDIWEPLEVNQCHEAGLSNEQCRKPQLIRAAAYKIKYLKVLSYVSEVVCGLFLIGSHVIIWYFSEERHYDLPESLWHRGTAERGLTRNLRRYI